MDLQPVTTGADTDTPFVQRGAQCLVRLARVELTARALGSLTVRDPSDRVACLQLHLVETLYAALLGLGSRSARRSFVRFSISPAALA